MHNQIRFTPSLLRRPLRFIVIATLLGALLMAPAAATAAPEKILVFPFTIHAEKDMAFLNNGIVSMLMSRLNKPGKTVTEAAAELPGTPRKVQELARSQGARYYTAGSLTLFGNSVSTDARLIETDTGKTVVAYNQYGERAGDVLAHMDAFAKKVEAQFTEAAAPKAAQPAPAPAVAAPAAAAAATVVAAGTAAVVAAAPQPRVATPAPAATPTPAATPAPSLPTPGVKMSAPAAAAVVVSSAAAGGGSADTAGADIGFFESQTIGEEIRSLATGDIDGDGRIEIISASARRVSVYRFEGGKLVPLGGYNSKKELTIISVDVADVNGNGVSEIFVSRLLEMPRSRTPNVRQWDLNGVVLEQQNGRLVEIATGLKYYVRSLILPNNERLMLAQKRGIAGTYGEQDFMNKTGTGALFLGNVFHLEWKEGQYAPGDPMLLPKNITLYDFTLGDILDDGTEIITALKGKGYLTLLEPSGKVKWSGKDRFGGTGTYLEYPSMEGTSEMDRYYIRQRLFITDIDADGRNEVILSNNYDFAQALTSRFKIYTNGNIACMAWGKRSMQKIWETEEIKGFISDLAVSDMNGDGRPELIYAIVGKTENSFSDGESFIVIQKPPTGSNRPSQ